MSDPQTSPAAMQKIINALEDFRAGAIAMGWSTLKLECAISAARAMQVQMEGVPAHDWIEPARAAIKGWSAAENAEVWMQMMANLLGEAIRSVEPSTLAASPAVSALKVEAGVPTNPDEWMNEAKRLTNRLVTAAKLEASYSGGPLAGKYRGEMQAAQFLLERHLASPSHARLLAEGVSEPVQEAPATEAQQGCRAKQIGPDQWVCNCETPLACDNGNPGGAAAPILQAAVPEVTTDQCIELAAALEQRRALKIVEDVKAMAARFVGADPVMPTQYQAAWETACEEIEHRLRTEVWDLCLPPVGASPPTPEALEAAKPVAMFDYLGNSRVRYVSLKYDGQTLVIPEADLPSYRPPHDDTPYAVGEVYLSKEEFRGLPEFDGF